MTRLCLILSALIFSALLVSSLFLALPAHAADEFDKLLADAPKPAPAKSQPPAVTPAASSDNLDWMQVGAQETDTHLGVIQGKPDLATITGTTTPKATADLSKFTRVYTLDLQQFNISNTGTNPVETSKGINQALQHAKTQNANLIKFPPGTYLISEADPIILNLQDTVIDLSGASLQINTNALPKYTLIDIVDGAQNLRLTNGTLKGDRDTHDYKTTKASHEHACGLTFSAGKNIEVDRLTITNFPGSGVSTRVNVGKGALNFHWIRDKDLVPGALSDTGEKLPSDKKLITAKRYDISNTKGQFEFGYTLGYAGFPSVRGRAYQSFFFDADNKFIAKVPCLQFAKVNVPPNAKFVQFEFNQPTIKNGPEGMIGRITNLTSPSHIHFHHNTLLNNRTLGMAFCGGQNWVIEHNRFESNGGNAPGFGVDFEDGWDLMREVVFRNNTFKANKAGDLVVCAGTELIFESNTFENAVILYDRVNNYLFASNTLTGSRVLYKTGIKHAVIRNNTYTNATLDVRWNEQKWPGVPPLALTGESLDAMTSVTGPILVFDNCKITNSRFVPNKDSKLLLFKNCSLTNSPVLPAPAGITAPKVTYENCTITPTP
jgi:hypothetical protein